jgi:hypothetical protein
MGIFFVIRLKTSVLSVFCQPTFLSNLINRSVNTKTVVEGFFKDFWGFLRVFRRFIKHFVWVSYGFFVIFFLSFLRISVKSISNNVVFKSQNPSNVIQLCTSNSKINVDTAIEKTHSHAKRIHWAI